MGKRNIEFQKCSKSGNKFGKLMLIKLKATMYYKLGDNIKHTPILYINIGFSILHQLFSLQADYTKKINFNIDDVKNYAMEASLCIKLIVL